MAGNPAGIGKWSCCTFLGMALLAASLTAAHGAAFNLDNVCAEASSATSQQIAQMRSQVLAEVARAESEAQAAEGAFAQARQRLEAYRTGRPSQLEVDLVALFNRRDAINVTDSTSFEEHDLLAGQIDNLMQLAKIDILSALGGQLGVNMEPLPEPSATLVQSFLSANADRARAIANEENTREAAGAALACLKKREATFANAAEQELAYLQAKATELTATFKGQVQQLQAMIKAAFEGRQPNPAQEARIKRELKSTGEALLKVVAQVQEKGGKVSADTQQMVQAYQSFRAKL